MEQNYESIDQADKNAAIAVINEILISHTLTEDSLKFCWPDSDNRTVNKIGKAIRKMAKSLNKCFYRDLSHDVPFFMLKQLQNMQALLMSDYKAKIGNSFLRVTAFICFLICFGGIILGLFLKRNHESFLREKLHELPIFFILFILVIISNYLLNYIKTQKWLSDKPIYWPFRSKKQYDIAMEKFAGKITNPDYLKNHRMVNLYNWLLVNNPTKPFYSDRLSLLIILEGCPIFSYLPDTKEVKKNSLKKLSTLLSQIYKIYGNNQNSPYNNMLRQAEFFLTTQREYIEIKQLYSSFQQLKYTVVAVLIIVVAVIILAASKILPESMKSYWGVMISTAITLFIVIIPTIYTNRKSEKQMQKDVSKIPYWPFISQDDFDAAKKEYPRTAYLLEPQKKDEI